MVLAVDLVRRGAGHHGPRTAVRFGDEALTFTQVDEAANRFANVLLAQGLTKGDPVALLLGNGPWTISMNFACLKTGLVRVPLNGRLSVPELENMLTETGARHLIHAPELGEVATALSSRVAGLTTTGLGSPSADGGPDLLAEAETASSDDPHIPLEPHDPMMLIYTSGTTGRLKAVTHTQASWAAIATNILTNLVSPQPDSVMLHAASLIHASGTFVLPYWIRGGCSAILSGFEPEGFAAAVGRYRATEINLVPTMLAMLFSSGAAGRVDTSTLRTVIYGASPMPRPVLRQAMEAWGPIFAQYYGQTEAPLCITVLDQHDHLDESLLASCGFPSVDTEVRLVTETGAEAERGEIGEIQVRAAHVMAGYHAADELNAEMLAGDGWLRTRDMARFDDRGALFLVDRRSDMIITGGYNVYPREVEDALMAHDAVAECAVVGAPDEVWVEAVTAFVALKPGTSVGEAELQDFVRSSLAGYKVPKRVEFIDAVPKSAVGKLLRRALRDPLWESR